MSCSYDFYDAVLKSPLSQTLQDWEEKIPMITKSCQWSFRWLSAAPVKEPLTLLKLMCSWSRRSICRSRNGSFTPAFWHFDWGLVATFQAWSRSVFWAGCHATLSAGAACLREQLQVWKTFFFFSPPLDALSTASTVCRHTNLAAFRGNLPKHVEGAWSYVPCRTVSPAITANWFSRLLHNGWCKLLCRHSSCNVSHSLLLRQ